ncbi:MAG TPA: hypothetical protein VMT38_09040 [Terracidiphilus sp.]|nr:hypothetical protein [Terracidiphilus sp.]
MVVVPLTQGTREQVAVRDDETSSTSWIRYVAAGTLAASGVLLVTGQRRLGLVTALSGAALTLIDQQEAVRKCWDALPEFLEELQGLLGRTQTAVEDLSNQSQKLRKVLSQ